MPDMKFELFLGADHPMHPNRRHHASVGDSVSLETEFAAGARSRQQSVIANR